MTPYLNVRYSSCMTTTAIHPSRLITGCDSCDNGCMCEGGTPGCEHFGCWGTTPTDTCPSMPQHRAAWVAWNPQFARYWPEFARA